MPTLTIDQSTVTVPDGTTILDAAAKAGIAIPTLCHRNDLLSLSGCMVCAVRDEAAGRLIPACATPAAEGMRIATTAPDALALRRTMLELLLSNHAADCEGPCQLACPCHFDIPAMLHHLARNEDDAALAIVLEKLPLPVILAHICPAPCEKSCRRAAVDTAVSICAAKRFSGEKGRFSPKRATATGKRVLIVGAGPTGLAAAFYLQLQGHDCEIVEAESAPGVALCKVVGSKLPASAVEQDVARLREIGVKFTNSHVLTPAEMPARLAAFDAIVLAAGVASAALGEALKLNVKNGLLEVDRETFQTSNPKVFAGGAAVQRIRIAVLACAHGRAIAENLGAFLATGKTAARVETFQSRAGRMSAESLANMLADVDKGARQLPPAGGEQPAVLADDTVRFEANRCLRCECLKQKTCHLRELCAENHAKAPVTLGIQTPPGRIHAQPGISMEAAKCVLCGICVRTASKLGATCGPAFHGRGFEMRIAPPLGRTWDDIPRDVLLACADACPTGALAREAR